MAWEPLWDLVWGQAWESEWDLVWEQLRVLVLVLG